MKENIVAFANNEKYQRWFLLIGVLVVAVFGVLVPKTMGFTIGHHAWVSAEQLATILRSSPENGFVGYRMLLDSDPTYFTKASIIFNAVFNALLWPFSDISTKLFVARLIMDIVYVLNIFLLFKLLHIFTTNWKISAIAVLFGFSGFLATQYRDMIVPDNFLLLSFLISSFAIYYAKRGEFKKSVVLMAISVSLGYVLINLLPYIFWGLYEVYATFRYKTKISNYLKIMVAAATISCAFFSYNVVMEAFIRDVPIEETNVIGSALRRSGIDKDHQPEQIKTHLEFSSYMPMMLARWVEDSLLPSNLTWGKFKSIHLLIILMIFSMFFKNNTFKVKDLKKEELLAILIVSSSYTFFALWEYSFYHDFSGVPLSVLSSLVWFIILFRFRKYFYLLATLALTVFYIANVSQMKKKAEIVDGKLFSIHDFDAINSVLKEKSANDIYIENDYRSMVQGSPYSSGFLLSDYNIVTSRYDADFSISTSKSELTLTKKNEFHFLNEVDKTQQELELEKFNKKMNKLEKFLVSDTANFKIYLKNDTLIFFNSTITRGDLKNQFFLHVFPENNEDLPENRRQIGYYNGNFWVSVDSIIDGELLLEKKLPNFAVKSLNVGQFDGNAKIWEVKFEVAK